jgi:S-adenosylmethionine synthetase
MVDTFGTGKVSDCKLVGIVRNHFQLTPQGIIESLNLLRPIYQKTAAYGHFGRNEPEFSWEKTTQAARLREEAGL